MHCVKLQSLIPSCTRREHSGSAQKWRIVLEVHNFGRYSEMLLGNLQSLIPSHIRLERTGSAQKLRTALPGCHYEALGAQLRTRCLTSVSLITSQTSCSLMGFGTSVHVMTSQTLCSPIGFGTSVHIITSQTSCSLMSFGTSVHVMTS